MSTGLSDRAASRAVLIGVHHYAEGAGLAQLPAVRRNIASLRETLCDDAVWGLAEQDCTVLGPEAGLGSVMQAIDSAAHQATDTLLIYYAGHGLLHPDRPTELHLALHDSNDHQMWRSLPYAHIRDEVRAAHRRRGLKCAVVLDCCFSGAAVEGSMGRPPEKLLQQVSDIDGVCVLTSSAATEIAFCLPDQELSAFTGALLGILREGLPDAGPVLDFGTLHGRLQQELGTRDQPQHPQLGAHNSGERIAIFRNPAFPSHAPLPGGGQGLGVPAPPERLFGRDRELRDLTGAAAGGPGALVVHGPPGVGKSALVAEMYRALTPEGAVGSAGTPVVLLDDVDEAEEVTRAVTAAPDSLVLVTSRSSLPGVSARRYPLAPLRIDHAVAMLRDLSGIAKHGRELAEIARLLSCVPLALRLVADRLRRTPTDVLLDVMRESERPLQHFPADDERVRTAFTASYEALTAPQKTLLHDCAGHPGPDFDRHSAAAVSRMPPGICGLKLEELVDAGLLQRTDGRYTFHGLYRDYAHLAEAETEARVAEAGAPRRTRLYLHLRGALRDARGRSGVQDTWRRAASAELRAAARAAREDGWHLATELSCEIAESLAEERRFQEAREEADAAHLHATSRHDGPAMARARSCLALLGGGTGTWQRPPEARFPAARNDSAEELHSAARAAHASSGDVADRGQLLTGLAQRAMAAGLVEEAMEFQADARACLEESDDTESLAECLVGQAALHIYVGRYPEASDLARTAARLLDERGDREGAAHAHASAAEALRKAGEPEKAARHAHLALDRFAPLGDPPTLAYAHRLAAKIAWAEGDHDLARQLMQSAQEMHRLSEAEEGPSTRAIAHPSRALRTARPEAPAMTATAFADPNETTPQVP
ncbi:AAA family ATPase [Streptomyces sp. NPDC048172]|uniref:caspase, EACC1-associated type n=1 Tax=Streptomyces sp. NPDC048172 TaxID=3365505 RepID=UPI003723A455